MKNDKHRQGGYFHGSCGRNDNGRRLPRLQMVTLPGAFLAAALMLGWLKFGPGSLQTCVYILSSLTGGVLIFPRAFSSAWQGHFDMNVLMVVAVSGAWFINEGAEGSAVVLLFALSELLQSWSFGRVEPDAVYTGRINGEGTLKVVVTKASADSTLARIMRLAERRRIKKPQRSGSWTIARIYKRVVLVVAMAVGLLQPLAAEQPWFA